MNNKSGERQEHTDI